MKNKENSYDLDIFRTDTVKLKLSCALVYSCDQKRVNKLWEKSKQINLFSVILCSLKCTYLQLISNLVAELTLVPPEWLNRIYLVTRFFGS